MKNKKTHIDHLDEYFNKNWMYGKSWSRTTREKKKKALEDLYESLNNIDYKGHMIVNGKHQEHIIFLFNNKEEISYILEESDDYKLKLIENPENYLKSIITINKFNL